ncbi:MAG: fatty acid desaturase [Polyangiaceae bacterium]
MTDTSVQPGSIAPDELGKLQQRSDAKGLQRLAGHLLAIALSASVYSLAIAQAWHWLLLGANLVAYGFTLVTMFAAMHEAVHRTAFKSQRLNDAAAWFAGLLSFYNSTFYRPYHGWHHRYTQIPGKDPELDDPKPVDLWTYAVELSGVTWWFGKLKTHFTLALGRTAGYPFLNERNAPGVVRSVRLQLLSYGAAIAASVALGYPYFLTHWLLPVAAAQPLLRAILLAEHTGCSQDDNPLSNTRTTYTLWPVRLLMWEMPYHAEHHRYPALPFHTLAEAHALIGPALVHVERAGYTGLHESLLAELSQAHRTKLPHD